MAWLREYSPLPLPPPNIYFKSKISNKIVSPMFLDALSKNIISSNNVLVLKSPPAIHLSFNALNTS